MYLQRKKAVEPLTLSERCESANQCGGLHLLDRKMNLNKACRDHYRFDKNR